MCVKMNCRILIGAGTFTLVDARGRKYLTAGERERFLAALAQLRSRCGQRRGAFAHHRQRAWTCISCHDRDLHDGDRGGGARAREPGVGVGSDGQDEARDGCIAKRGARAEEGDLPGRHRRAGAPGRRDRRRDAPHPSPAGAGAHDRELRSWRRTQPTVSPWPGGPGGWWILDEPELHLGEDILVPDLAGWHRERMPERPDTPYFTLAPDWACEVLSPSTRRLDLQGKRPIYAREGVAHLWLIEPADRTLEVFELRDGQWVLIACAKDDEPVNVRPFDAITFSLGDLWA